MHIEYWRPVPINIHIAYGVSGFQVSNTCKLRKNKTEILPNINSDLKSTMIGGQIIYFHELMYS